MSNLHPRFIHIASAVRVALERRFPRRKGLRNLCTLSACAIVQICRATRISAEPVGGVYRTVAAIDKPQFGNPRHIAAKRSRLEEFPHAWVKHRRNYVDVTLTQFDQKARAISISETSDPRYRGRTKPLEFMVMALPLCGSSEAELKRVVNLACRILMEDAAMTPLGIARKVVGR